MKKSLSTLLQYLLFLGLGIFFVWLTVKDVTAEQWEHIKYSVSHGRQWLLFPAMILLFIAHYSRALRWKILMQPLGYKPGNFNTFAAVMIGYLVNAGVPRLGEVVKCTLLAKYEKVRADKLVGTIVVERAMDVVCLLIVFGLSLIFQGHIIGGFISQQFGDAFRDKTGNISGTRVAVITGVVVATILLIYLLLKRFAHINAIAKIKGVLMGIGQGLGSIKQVEQKGMFVFYTILIWVLYLSGTTIGIYALQETAFMGIGGGLTTLAVGSIGMIITPGGIGAYPLLVAGLMGAYGVEDTIGLASGWLLWSVQTLVILLGGLVCFALLSYFNKNKQIENRQQPQNTKLA